jgi:hypothetical protein
MKHLLFIIFLINFPLFAEETSFIFNQEIDELIQKTLKSCDDLKQSSYKYETALVDNLKGFKYIALDKKTFIGKYNAAEFRNVILNTLSSKHCDHKLSKDLKFKIKMFLLPIYRKDLNQLTDDIISFKDSKLSYGSLLRYYDKYKRINEIEYLDDHILLKKIRLDFKNFKTSRSQSCTNVMNLNLPLNVYLPRDQSSIGWCYAFTAADLISHKIKQNVSPLYIALKFNESLYNSLRFSEEGGLITLAISEAKKGICLDENFPELDKSRIIKYTDAINEIRLFIEKIKNDSDINQNDILQDICQNETKHELFKTFFPNTDFLDIAKILLKAEDLTAMKEMADISCAPKINSELSKMKLHFHFTENEIYKNLDEQLNKGNIIGIDYNSNVFADYNNYALFADHASSIIGRRFNQNTKSCEYLIRNSWGSTCDSGYNLDLLTCDNGNIWISEDILKNKSQLKVIEYLD